MRTLSSILITLIALVTPAAAQLGDAGKLLPAPPAADPAFASNYGQVAMDGDYAIAADSLSSPTRFGFVFVYERTTTGWQLVAELQDPSPMLGVSGYSSEFGFAIDISGTTIVVTNPGHSTGLKENPPCCTDQRLGIVHVYELINGGWILTDSLTQPNPHVSEQLGFDAVIQGDVLFASTTNRWGGDNQSWHGAVFQYERSGSSWDHAASFVSPSSSPGDQFGAVMAIHGDTLLINADATPADPALSNDLVHAYKNTGTSWSYTGDLTPTATPTDSAYGIRLAVQGSFAAVGAPSAKGKGNKTAAGAVHIFARDAADNWVETEILTAGDPSSNAQFGRALDFDSDTLLIGSPYDDTLGNNAGSVYHFERWGTSFNEIAKLVPGDNAPGDEFGTSLAISRGNAMVSAPLDDDSGFNFGSVYLYGCGNDSDGDGLCDDWETRGIPYYDSDGVLQRYLLDLNGDGLSDADPDIIDLFVELDVMSPNAAAPNMVFGIDEEALLGEAFLDAPVVSPQGPIGISLHLDVQQNVFPFNTVEFSEDGWPDNDIARERRAFGTFEEQTADDSIAILNAKAKAFRYGVAFNDVAITTEDFDSIGGLAELPGDDFVIYLDSFSTPKARAATFMHELGHTLGLGHGGGDHINGKPNYPSIMNYTLADEMPWNEDFWMLDFSREALAPLDEFALDESVPFGAGGSGYYNNWFMPYSTLVPPGSCLPENQWDTLIRRYACLSTTLCTTHTNDLNANCDTDLAATVDLNYLSQGFLPGPEDDPSPNQLLTGFNDWANLRYAISDGGGAFRGPVPPYGEPSTELIELVRTTFDPPNPPCPADLNNDGILDNGDIGAFISLFLAGDIATDFNGDGFLDNGDIGAFIAAFLAGC